MIFVKLEIDLKAAWEALYSTRSRAFPKPETGKVAVKVINHYGDEVVKILDIIKNHQITWYSKTKYF